MLKSQRGFTLVEFAVSLVLMAVMLVAVSVVLKYQTMSASRVAFARDQVSLFRVKDMLMSYSRVVFRQGYTLPPQTSYADYTINGLVTAARFYEMNDLTQQDVLLSPNNKIRFYLAYPQQKVRTWLSTTGTPVYVDLLYNMATIYTSDCEAPLTTTTSGGRTIYLVNLAKIEPCSGNPNNTTFRSTLANTASDIFYGVRTTEAALKSKGFNFVTINTLPDQYERLDRTSRTLDGLRRKYHDLAIRNYLKNPDRTLNRYIGLGHTDDWSGVVGSPVLTGMGCGHGWYSITNLDYSAIDPTAEAQTAFGTNILVCYDFQRQDNYSPAMLLVKNNIADGANPNPTAADYVMVGI